MSFSGQNGLAREDHSSSYANQNMPSEDSILRFSQVEAWIKYQAGPEEREKIQQILLAASTASSSTHTYGGTDLLYQGGSQIRNLDPIAAQISIVADPVSASGLCLSGDFDQYPDYTDPTSFIQDFNMNSSAGQISTFSMASSSEPYYPALPSRSWASLRSEPSNAVTAASSLLRQSLTESKRDKARDSVQSTGSHNSMGSDMGMSWSSKHSSTSSLGGRSALSPGKYSQKSMNSSIKKPHSRSSSLSRTSNLILPSDIPCEYPDCGKTFTRIPDRRRHEATMHNSEVIYTCLLHTCAASCSELCTNKIHRSSYHYPRSDKMKEHLEKLHGWSLKPSEIPQAFQGSYERQQRGWVCNSCQEDIGNWHDNCEYIAGHYKDCAAALQASFKRMSVEESGIDGAKTGGDMEKGWPLTSSNQWLQIYLDEMNITT